MSLLRRFQNLWWPEPVTELSLEAWRIALTAYTLRLVLLGGGLTLAVVWASFGLEVQRPRLWFATAVYLMLVLAVKLGRSPAVRAHLLFAACLLVAAVFLALRGPAPAPLLLLLLPCALAALLLGQRAGVAYLVLALAVLVASSAFHLSRPPHAGQPLDLRVQGELRDWFRVGLTWFMVTGWLVYVASWLTLRMDQALKLKADAVATAHHEHARREVADLQRQATEDVLIEAQRHEALGRVTGSVSHDFNNALFVILGWNDLLSRGETSVEQRRVGHAAIAAAGRHAAELARRLVGMSHGTGVEPACAEPRPVLEDAVRYLTRLLPENVRIEAHLPEVPGVALSAGELQQLVLNLALEARDGLPEGGRVKVSLGTDPAHPARVQLELLAESPTPPARDAAGGSGMEFSGTPTAARVALTAARAIVSRCGGELETGSPAPGSARFSALLPVAAAGGAVPRPGLARSQRAERIARILVVEDDPAVRELMVVALRARGHVVREARDGDAALEQLSLAGAEDELLCIDGIIPGAPSTSIIAQFRALRPGRPILVCSGYLGTPQLQALVQEGQLPFLPKPFTPDELADKVQELLEAASGQGSTPSRV